MEFFIILLFIFVIILILTFRNATMDRLDRIDHELSQLRQRIEERPQQPAAPQPAAPAAPTQSPAQPPRPPTPVGPPPQPLRPAIPVESRPEAPQAPPPSLPSEPRVRSAARQDWEKFIGENLVSKIGIAILVLAIGFFVKYAIDNNWIGPVGRVAVGLICGSILIALAHLLRNNYKAFSSVLVGGGLAIFYFSITLAYHQYALLSQTVTFVIMLVITAFAVLLSLLYDRQELAVISLVGGFLAPFLASNGSGNYQVLFSYLIILNTGLLVIAYHKTWRILNLLAFLFTAILFTGWLITLPDSAKPGTYTGGFLFATAFYILFFLINVAYTIKQGQRFIASDFGILLVNTCCYFSAGIYLLTQMEAFSYRGLFCASLAIFNLAASYFLFRKKTVDSNVLYLLVGITMTLVSLTAPIQLHGHAITLFWASEMVLLYWLSGKSGIRIIRWASFVVGLAMTGSLLIDWVQVYGTASNIALPVIFNRGLMTSLYAAACCYALFLLQKAATNDIARYASLIIGSALLFLGGALEIDHQFNFYYPDTDLYILYLILYGFSLVFLLVLIADRRWFREHSYSDWITSGCLVAYLALIGEAYAIQANMLESGKNNRHFAVHWITSLLVALMFTRLINRLRSGKIKVYPSMAVVSRMLGIFAVVFLSVEINLLVNGVFFGKAMDLDRIGQLYARTGLPILWGLCSFVFMWLGMSWKFKPLRVLSLLLFSITLLKLFLYDIRDIPVAGKIAAFFCLGVLLLVVSFMYQRLKKILIEDADKEKV